MERNSQLKTTISVQGLALNATSCYQLDERVDWVASLLEELNEKVSPCERGGLSSSLNFNLEVTHKSGGGLRDYLTLTGQIHAQFITRCVSSCEVMQEFQKTLLNAIVIPREYERSMGLKEETVFFTDNREWDLFYYDLKVDVVEIIHEYLYLNKKPLP